MTKYYFHLWDHNDYIRDDDGTELPDLDAARHEAVLAAREMIAELVLDGEVIDGRRFEIKDENGTLLEVVPFKSVLRLD